MDTRVHTHIFCIYLCDVCVRAYTYMTFYRGIEHDTRPESDGLHLGPWPWPIQVIPQPSVQQPTTTQSFPLPIYTHMMIHDAYLQVDDFQERISKGPQGEHEEGFSEWLRQRDQQEMATLLDAQVTCI